MLQDIAIFLGIFLIILSSFASGLYYLYHKYDGEVRYENGHKVAEQIKAFNTLDERIFTIYATWFMCTYLVLVYLLGSCVLTWFMFT